VYGLFAKYSIVVTFIKPPVKVQIMIHALNLPPIRFVEQIKQRVRDAVLDGLIPNDREAALVFARAVASELGIFSANS